MDTPKLGSLVSLILFCLLLSSCGDGDKENAKPSKRIKSQTTFYTDAYGEGLFSDKHLFTYNADNKVESLEISSNGSLRDVYTFSYTNGVLTKAENYTRRFDYEYESNKLLRVLIYEKFSYNSDTPEFIHQRVYTDGEKFPSKIRLKVPNLSTGEIETRYTAYYDYDNQGNVIRASTFIPNFFGEEPEKPENMAVIAHDASANPLYEIPNLYEDFYSINYIPKSPRNVLSINHVENDPFGGESVINEYTFDEDGYPTSLRREKSISVPGQSESSVIEFIFEYEEY